MPPVALSPSNGPSLDRSYTLNGRADMSDLQQHRQKRRHLTRRGTPTQSAGGLRRHGRARTRAFSPEGPNPTRQNETGNLRLRGPQPSRPMVSAARARTVEAKLASASSSRSVRKSLIRAARVRVMRPEPPLRLTSLPRFDRVGRRRIRGSRCISLFASATVGTRPRSRIVPETSSAAAKPLCGTAARRSWVRRYRPRRQPRRTMSLSRRVASSSALNTGIGRPYRPTSLCKALSRIGREKPRSCGPCSCAVGRETYAGSARAFAEALRAAFDKGSRP